MSSNITFQDLLVDHEYYCHTANFYSNEPNGSWLTWAEYYEEFKDCDIDMNLVFRWDIKKRDPGTYYMEIFMMHQRKGIFSPHTVEVVTEADLPTITEYLQAQYDHMQKLWQPFSKPIS